MISVLKICLAGLLIFVHFGVAYGESLSLQQAVNIALKNNSVLRSYHWTVESQKEDLRIAKGRLYPLLRIEERYQRTNNPTYGFMARLNQERFTQDDFLIDSLNNPDAVSDFQTSLSFEQPLFVPMLYSGINMTGRELEAKQAEYRRKKEEVILEVVKTFNRVQTAEVYLRAAHKGVQDAREHKRISSLRYDADMGLYSDVLRAEVSGKKAEAMLIKVETDLEISRRALGLLLGRNGPVYVSGEKPLLSVGDMESYLQASMQRGDLHALRLRRENSQQAVKSEKAFFLPEMGVGGSYLLNDHETPFYSEGESYVITGFLRWNLFDAAAYYKISKAKTKAHEAEEHLSGLEREISFRINEAYLRVKEKRQNLSLAGSVLKEADEALRLVKTRYENGLAPMVDLLDTQSVVDNARAGVAEAENEYMNAIADLYYQSGILLKSLKTD